MHRCTGNNWAVWLHLYVYFCLLLYILSYTSAAVVVVVVAAAVELTTEGSSSLWFKSAMASSSCKCCCRLSGGLAFESSSIDSSVALAGGTRCCLPSSWSISLLASGCCVVHADCVPAPGVSCKSASDCDTGAVASRRCCWCSLVSGRAG